MITLRKTTVGKTPLDEWSAQRRELQSDNTQYSQDAGIHVPVGYEPAILASERSKNHALDRAVTGKGAGPCLLPE